MCNRTCENNIIAKISELSNRLHDIGLPMSYHPHMGTIIQSEKDVEKLTRKIEQILPDELFLRSSGSEFSTLLTNYSMGHYDYSGKNASL